MNSDKTGTPTSRESGCPDACPHFRIGLPILPVRYAVLGSDSQLPGLAATFDDPGLVGLKIAPGMGCGCCGVAMSTSTTKTTASLTATWLPAKGPLWKLSPGIPEPLDQEGHLHLPVARALGAGGMPCDTERPGGDEEDLDLLFRCGMDTGNLRGAPR